jgi:UDP-3-O-[3-hydroxymyristoyl] N-acetylglucosamine deacetylase
MSSPFQQTIARAVEITGIGLHGAQPVRAVLRPSRSGIVFRRLDLERELASRRQRTRVEIAACVENVSQVDHATTLAAVTPAGPAQVQTVEHLLSALHGLGIDACTIELDAPEVPILDGSSAPWVALLRSAGRRRLARPRKIRRLLEPFAVELGEASIVAYPSSAPRVTCSIDFDHPAIGRQERAFTITPESYADDVAPARTFGFLGEVVALQAKGLIRGGSYDNAVVLDDGGVVSGDLRFADEFVRHKALDLLGDLALAGMPLQAHVVARRAGHRLHVEFLRRLLASPSCWTVEDMSAAVEAAPALLAADVHLASAAPR